MHFAVFGIDKYNSDIRDVVSDAMASADLDYVKADCFIDLVGILSLSGTKFSMSVMLANRICNTVKKFISYENFCAKCTNLILPSMNETKSKHIVHDYP